MEPTPATEPKSIDDVAALQRCVNVIEKVQPPQDRLRVVKYLQDKYLTDFPAQAGLGG